MKQKLYMLFVMIVMMAMSPVKMWAENISFTATAGTKGNSVKEDFDKAFDADKSTKWCVGGLSGTNTIYVEFYATSPLFVTGYTFTTADDTYSNPNRNPKNWELMGKLDSTETTWTTIDTQTDNTSMPTNNYSDGIFNLSECTATAYKYFRLEITVSSDCFQLSEISIQGSAAACEHPKTLTHHEEVQATCTTTGSKEYWSCPVCGQRFSSSTASEQYEISADDIVIPATGEHSYNEETHKCLNCSQFDTTVVNYSGTADVDCEWVITKDSALVIFPSNGTSASLGYYSYYYPWETYWKYVKSVKIVGEVIAVQTAKMFMNLSNLASADLTGLNTTNVTNMYGMFRGCEKLTSLDLSNLNTANVKDMSQMFYSCESLTSLDLSSFNTDSVTNMDNMFGYCKKLESLNLSSFNTANVTNMGSMFYYCTALTSLDLSNFNTANVWGMGDMFYNCKILKSINLSSFNTANVTHMDNMFRLCYALDTLTIGNFDMSKVEHYDKQMFLDCTKIRSLTLKALPFLMNCGFKNFSKKKYELDDNSLVYTGENNYLPEATSAPTYTREMSNKWGTVVVPFAIKYDADNGDYELYKLTEADVPVNDGDDSGTLTFAKYEDDEVIAAGTPMAIKAVGSKNTSGKYEVTLTANDNTISTDINSYKVTKGNVIMNGTYAKETIGGKAGQWEYFLAQNTFYWAEAEATVNPFRAWFELDYGVDGGEGGIFDAPARSFNIVEEGATGIATVNNELETMVNGKVMEDGKVVIVRNGKRYNLNGLSM